MNKNDAPCLGCKLRKLGCHSKCLFYRDWKAEQEAESEYIKAVKDTECYISSRRRVRRDDKRRG